MNLTDLFEERSAEPPASVLHHLRLAGVRRKVVLRRRRRVVAGAAAVLVAIGAFGAGATAVTGPERGVGPVEQRTIEGFPEYANGARVVEAASTELPDTELSLTFTPITSELAIFYRCNIPEADNRPHQGPSIEVSWGGGPAASDCADDGDGFSTFWPSGLPAGEPVTVTAVVTTWADRPPQPLPESGSFALAIGVPVPFEEYPFPPPPSELTPLDWMPRGSRLPLDPVLIWSDPADPNRPQEMTVSWERLQSINMAAQTPGRLRVLVDGVEVALGTWWNYDQGVTIVDGDVAEDSDWQERYGLRLEPGEKVTITVIPERMTGEWAVNLVQKEREYYPPEPE